MPYLLAAVVISIAVVFLGRAREVRVDRAVTGPTGRPRASRGSTSGGGTANERVGQG